jgi:prevent-host-death family protein
MRTLTFRNKQGELVDVPSIPATRLKNEFGTVFDQAMRDGAVAITRHDTPRAVLISYEEFESLAKARSTPLEDRRAQFDALLGRMQTPAARKGMEVAFNATPAELGRAAKAASKGRKLASKKGLIRAGR